MNKPFIKYSILAISAVVFALSCGSGSTEQLGNPNTEFTRTIDPQWTAFWNQGLAEVSSYTLNQARYGEIHQGDAVLIFVTEPFSLSKQVKIDEANSDSKDYCEVFKMNAIRHFPTGIYDYSVMESVFTPVKSEKAGGTLKATCSVQDWCGQVFSQLNLKNDRYRFRQFSYFETESDEDQILEKAILEDEVWTLLRLNPELLPQGVLNMIPSLHFLRFMHLEAVPYPAIAKNEVLTDFSVYTISYSKPKRELKIYYNSAFPYEIQGWDETYLDGFGADSKMLTSTAKLKHSMMTDYWNKHGISDSTFRKELMLD